MKHLRGDCPKADPASDELCEFCHKCPEEECIREVGHTGFHWSQEDIKKDSNPMKDPNVQKEWPKEVQHAYDSILFNHNPIEADKQFGQVLESVLNTLLTSHNNSLVEKLQSMQSTGLCQPIDCRDCVLEEAIELIKNSLKN